MKAVMTTLAVASAAAVLGAGSAPASDASRDGCIVPPLYTLTIPAAAERVAAAGCKLGHVSYERPRTHVAKVTAQVPLPGAHLPAAAHVELLVS